MNPHEEQAANVLRRMANDPMFVDDLSRLLDALVSDRLTASSVGAARFGDLLRQHRRAANLTQEELAERADISPRTLSDLERGPHLPRRATLTLLVEALNLPAADRAQLEASIVRRRGPRRLRLIGRRPLVLGSARMRTGRTRR